VGDERRWRTGRASVKVTAAPETRRPSSAHFDRVLDFDEVMKDPTNPDIMNPILEFGDHIHPSPFGYLKMGQSINLSVFQGAEPD